MKVEQEPDSDLIEDRTNWSKVYIYVLLWLAAMCALMVAFTNWTL